MPDASPTQVRVCPACRSPAARAVRARPLGTWDSWEPVRAPTAAEFGRPPSLAESPVPAAIVQATFRCQACGASFEWKRRGCLQILLVAMLGMAFPLCMFGLVVQAGLVVGGRGDPGAFFFLLLMTATLGVLVLRAAWPWVVERRWPPVDAPLPPLTHAAPPRPTRGCACGGSAPCTRTIPQVLRRSIPIGVAYEHRCAACGTSFTVHDNTSCAFAGFAAAYLTAVGLMVTLHPPGAAVGAEEGNRIFGYVVLAFGAAGMSVFLARVVGRLRHRAV